PVIDTHNMKIAAITDNGAVDDYVAISPDGKLVAYGLLEKPYKMVVKQLATGTEVKVLEGSDSLYSGAVFSPDGNFLYYRHRSGATFDLYSVPSLGGISRRVAVDVGSAVSFSPGGKQIAFCRSLQGHSQVVIADADGGQQHVIYAGTNDGRIFDHLSW